MANEFHRGQSARRFVARFKNRNHHRFAQVCRRIPVQGCRQKFRRENGIGNQNCLRRSPCAHAAHGLEQLRRLRRLVWRHHALELLRSPSGRAAGDGWGGQTLGVGGGGNRFVGGGGGKVSFG